MLRSLLALSFAFALTSSAAARAQESSANPAAEFHAGEAAFAEDDYVLALDHFRRAFELAPHDAVRFNIGVCLERLGRFREATVEYDRAAESTELNAEGRARALGLSQRTRARLGTLVITAPEPASAEVADLICETPCRLELDPGDYDVTVRGTNEATSRITVARGEEAHLEVDTTREPAQQAPEDAPTGWTSFGTLLGVGVGVAAVGIAGIVGFGLATEDAHNRFFGGMASFALAEEGALDRDLTNASIAVLGTGALMILIDVALLLIDPPAAPIAARDGVIHF